MNKHWAISYVGLPYSEYDCAELCVKVNLEQFNKTIKLPTHRPNDFRGLSTLIDDNCDDFAEKVDDIKEGDAILMIGRGRLNHIGIACFINKQLHVLHAMHNAGMAVLHNINALSDLGLTVEGYYRWK